MRDPVTTSTTTSSTDRALPGEALALYHSESCWFCARVRQTVRDLGLTLEMRSIDQASVRQELLAGGGKAQVPCLRLEYPDRTVKWMYESADIAAYLTQRFGT